MNAQNARTRIATTPMLVDIPTSGRAAIALARTPIDPLWVALVSAYRAAVALDGGEAGPDSMAARWTPWMSHQDQPWYRRFMDARTAWVDAWAALHEAERQAGPELLAVSLVRVGDGCTIPVGAWVHITGAGRDLALPPGLWAAYHHVTESPRGSEWATAVGILSAPLTLGIDGSYSSLHGRMMVCAVERPASIHGALLVRATGWEAVGPRNGPSFVGRLGGGGSHGPVTQCQGDLSVAVEFGV